ncbi:MAG TPA: hypothetical protein VGL83_06165 [Stellaceae bacterium]|jgi:hypothetical protein
MARESHSPSRREVFTSAGIGIAATLVAQAMPATAATGQAHGGVWTAQYWAMKGQLSS